jgi:hypothetical protein
LSLRNLALAATALIFLQLGLGATMRHEHAGLAIPDFPLAYGKILPDTSAASIAAINQARVADDKASDKRAAHLDSDGSPRCGGLDFPCGRRYCLARFFKLHRPLGSSGGWLVVCDDSRPDCSRRLDNLVQQSG